MNYSELVEQTKKELQKYSDTTAILTNMYNLAKTNYENAYKESAEILDKDYDTKRNSAAAQQKLNDKNTDELMASRGLAFSGESAQAKINSNISLANTLSSLESDHSAGLTELRKQRDEDLAKLDADYSEKRIKAENELNDTAIKMAQDKIKYGDVTLDVQNVVSNGNGDTGSSDSGDGLFEPSMTAYQLANAIVKRYGTGGKVQEAEQNLNINRYLKGLTERYSFTDDYLDKLNFVLDALGYIAMDDDGMYVATVVNGGNLEYDSAYERALSVAKKLYYDYDERNIYAKKRANMDRLDYIYTRCENMEQFYSACQLLELSNYEIEDYLETVSRRDGSANEIRLGENK